MEYMEKLRKELFKRKVEQTKNSYKEHIAIIKDTLDVIWKLSPAFFIPVGIMLRNYLDSSGWLSLFYDSATSGLIFLAVASILFSGTLILSYTIPSIVIIFMDSLSGFGHIVPKEVIPLHGVAALSWLLMLALVFMLGPSVPHWTAICEPILITFLYGVRNLNKFPLTSQMKYPEMATYGKLFLLASAATLAMCGTSFGLLISINVGTMFNDISDDKAALILALCVAISMTGTVPGFVYLYKRTHDKEIFQPLKFFSIAALCVAIILAGLMAAIPQAQLVFLRGAGIYSDFQVTYQILKPDNLAGALTAAGIDVKKDTSMSTFTACVRYNFAGTKLLCRDRFNPDGVTSAAINEARQRNMADPRITNGMHCVPAIASELRELRNGVPKRCE